MGEEVTVGEEMHERPKKVSRSKDVSFDAKDPEQNKQKNIVTQAAANWKVEQCQVQDDHVGKQSDPTTWQADKHSDALGGSGDYQEEWLNWGTSNAHSPSLKNMSSPTAGTVMSFSETSTPRTSIR